MILLSPKQLKGYNVDLTHHFAKKSKYNNRKVVIDGITFDSMAESDRYKELKLLQQAGEITELEMQYRICCVVNGVKVCDYYADFRYYDKRTHTFIVEDVKGAKTDVYKLKKKLVEALFPIEIIEI